MPAVSRDIQKTLLQAAQADETQLERFIVQNTCCCCRPCARCFVKHVSRYFEPADDSMELEYRLAKSRISQDAENNFTNARDAVENYFSRLTHNAQFESFLSQVLKNPSQQNVEALAKHAKQLLKKNAPSEEDLRSFFNSLFADPPSYKSSRLPLLQKYGSMVLIILVLLDVLVCFVLPHYAEDNRKVEIALFVCRLIWPFLLLLLVALNVGVFLYMRTHYPRTIFRHFRNAVASSGILGTGVYNLGSFLTGLINVVGPYLHTQENVSSAEYWRSMQDAIRGGGGLSALGSLIFLYRAAKSHFTEAVDTLHMHEQEIPLLHHDEIRPSDAPAVEKPNVPAATTERKT